MQLYYVIQRKVKILEMQNGMLHLMHTSLCSINLYKQSLLQQGSVAGHMTAAHMEARREWRSLEKALTCGQLSCYCCQKAQHGQPAIGDLWGLTIERHDLCIVCRPCKKRASMQD